MFATMFKGAIVRLVPEPFLREDGQGALQYALIIIALIAVIYIAYKFAASQESPVDSTFAYSTLHGVQGS